MLGNLSYHVTEENLRQAFESFGRVISARIVKDKRKYEMSLLPVGTFARIPPEEYTFDQSSIKIV